MSAAPRPRPAKTRTSNPVLAAAYGLAKSHNLRIRLERNRQGEVTRWRVYRAMATCEIPVGSARGPTALLALVKRLSTAIPNAVPADDIRDVLIPAINDVLES